LTEALLPRLPEGPAENVLPDGVQRDRHHVEPGDGQQITRKLPGTVAFAGAFLDPFAQGFVQTLEVLGRQLLLGDVHYHAEEAGTFAIFEEGLSAGFDPADAAIFTQHAIGGAEFAVAFLGDS